MPELIGQTVGDGRFLIERELGRGGMGVVFEAEDVLLKRQVAIKLITSQSDISAKRFEREVKSLAAVKCQYVPEIYTWGYTDDGLPFIVMELLSYSTLETLLTLEDVLPDTDICAIAIEITKALSIIHEAGIIHRDLKPGNVMVHFDAEQGWSIKLLDFGLVHSVASDQSLTRSDNVVGSIGYFCPEHAAPHLIDCRSDIFSLGCILFRAVTGQTPFEADNLFASVLLMNSDVRGKIPPSVPAYLRVIIWKCLQAKPENRFQNAAELREALTNKRAAFTLQDSNAPAKPNRLRLAVLVSTMTICAVLFAVSIFGRFSHHGGESAFSTGETLGQLLHMLAASKNVIEQKSLLKKLSKSDDFWALSTSTNRDDLRTIARLQFATADIENGELAYKCVFRSLSAKESASVEEKIETLNQQLARYVEAKIYSQKVINIGEDAINLSKGNPYLLRRSYYLLATLYHHRSNLDQKKDDIEQALFCYSCAHRTNTDLSVPDPALDAEIAMHYAELVSQTNHDPVLLSKLYSFAARKYNEILNQDRSLAYAKYDELYHGVTNLKNAPTGTALYRDVALLLERGLTTIPDDDCQLQLILDVAALKFKYDKTGALVDLRKLIKTAEQKKKWAFFICAVWMLADQKALTHQEFSDLMAKGYEKFRSLKETSPAIRFGASLKAASFSSFKDANILAALKYYADVVEDAKSFTPDNGYPNGTYYKIDALISAADYGLIHGRPDLARESFKQLDTATIPQSLKTRFKDVRAKMD